MAATASKKAPNTSDTITGTNIFIVADSVMLVIVLQGHTAPSQLV